jgi:hypothetical protein
VVRVRVEATPEEIALITQASRKPGLTPSQFATRAATSFRGQPKLHKLAGRSHSSATKTKLQPSPTRSSPSRAAALPGRRPFRHSKRPSRALSPLDWHWLPLLWRPDVRLWGRRGQTNLGRRDLRRGHGRGSGELHVLAFSVIGPPPYVYTTNCQPG